MPSIYDEKKKYERMVQRFERLPRAPKDLPNLCLVIQGRFRPEDEHMLWGWNVTLVHRGQRLSTEFKQGSAHEHPPTVFDVLYSVVSDAQCVHGNTFEDFCGHFGYNTDSRRAEQTYRACQDIATNLIKLFGDEQFLKLLRMEEDEIKDLSGDAPTFRA